MKEFFKTLYDLLIDFWPPVHKEGHRFVFIFFAITVFAWAMYEPLGYLGLALTVWCALFFRDPARVTPSGDHLVISPADGLIQHVRKTEIPEELGLGKGKKVYCVTIFLSVFDVHINRIPAKGTITNILYSAGKFLSANLEKASMENERNAMVIEVAKDKHVICTQIAGFVARRILCDAKEGQDVVAGERYGLIRFGSRADIYLPEGVNPMVIEGQRAIGGETILADMKSKAAAKKGEVR